MAFIKTPNLKPLQLVRTSGKGGIFPENIPIGHVVDTHWDETGLFNVARVRLAANLSALDEVWVRFP
jgi:cell shape-determining protein MreC